MFFCGNPFLSFTFLQCELFLNKSVLGDDRCDFDNFTFFSDVEALIEADFVLGVHLSLRFRDLLECRLIEQPIADCRFAIAAHERLGGL